MHIHVCSLAKLPATVKAIRPNRLVSLVHVDPPVPTPEEIEAAHHLRLSFHDIAEVTPGHVAPAEEHVDAILGFAEKWDRQAPMLIHCYAGISRSTAAAFIVACALHPDKDEAEIARRLRLASPSATPNPRLVALADARLGRGGRMIEAVAGIGRGRDAFEGTPFRLELG